MPVYQAKNGTWFVKCSYIDKFGERKYKTKRNFKLRRDAKAWEENFIDSIRGGNTADTLHFNVLADHYYQWYKEKNKPSSANSLKSHIKVNLAPYFKKMNVYNMEPQDILDFHSFMKDRNLSSSYIIKAQAHLTGMLNHAIRFFNLKTNVSSIAGTIKDMDVVTHNVWSLEEFETFYQRIDEIEHQAMFRLLFFSGMRKGEARALTWEDINFEEGYIIVNKTNYKGLIYTPKPKSSLRIVYMPDHVMNLLKEYQVGTSVIRRIRASM